jgi:hypothetical protein
LAMENRQNLAHTTCAQASALCRPRLDKKSMPLSSLKWAALAHFLNHGASPFVQPCAIPIKKLRAPGNFAQRIAKIHMIFMFIL